MSGTTVAVFSVSLALLLYGGYLHLRLRNVRYSDVLSSVAFGLLGLGGLGLFLSIVVGSLELYSTGETWAPWAVLVVLAICLVGFTERALRKHRR